MTLPNSQNAILGDKLDRYFLNLDHSVGKHIIYEPVELLAS